MTIGGGVKPGPEKNPLYSGADPSNIVKKDISYIGFGGGPHSADPPSIYYWNRQAVWSPGYILWQT